METYDLLQTVVLTPFLTRQSLKKAKRWYFSWITAQTHTALNRKVRGLANIRLANYAKNQMFFVSMEDGDKIEDEARSLIFFISAWLKVKTFASSGLLYVLLTDLGSKNTQKVLFFLTKSIHVLEITKWSKLKREDADFREKSIPANM